MAMLDLALVFVAGLLFGWLAGVFTLAAWLEGR
jgi:hypothetical protein